VQEHLGSSFELVDLLDHLQRETGFHGDVVSQLTEIDLAVVPNPKRLGCRLEQRNGLVFAVVTM
jgi:hypothetical protein